MDYSLRKSQSLNITPHNITPFKLHSCLKNSSSSSSTPSIAKHHHTIPSSPHHHLHQNHADDAVRHPMTSTPPPDDRQVVVEIDASNNNNNNNHHETNTSHHHQNNNNNNNGHIIITSSASSSPMYNNNKQHQDQGEESETESGRGSSLSHHNHPASTSSSPSVEFSFGRATLPFKSGPTSESPLMGTYLEQLSPVEMSLNIDMDYDMKQQHHHQQHQQQQQQNNEHNIRRQALQGLPPLYPDYCQAKNLSRHPSDLLSPDYTNACNNNNNNVFRMNNNNNNQSSNNSNSNNMDGSRETRVSFQESHSDNQHLHNHMGRSSFDDDDDDEDDDDDDDASSSKASDIHHDHVHDEEYGSTTRMIGGGMYGSHRRRYKKPSYGSNYNKEKELSNNVNNNSNNDMLMNRGGDDNNEVLRCTSNNSSQRKLSSTISIAKTKSRLMDPPMTPFDQRSASGAIPKSGQISNNTNKSGFLGRSYEEDEDDPFMEDDLPEEFKTGQISTLVILEWVSLVILIGSLVCSLMIKVLRHTSIWKLKLWKWEVFGLSLVCGRLLSGWVVKLLVFFIERNFLLRKRILYFVYGLKKAVQNVIWLGLVLLTWHCIFNGQIETRANSQPLKIITKLVVLGEVGAVLWLLKTFMVKVCASTFHVNAFFDRIQESLFNQFVIESLSAPPMFELRSAQEDEERTMAEVQMLQNAGMNVPPELNASVLSRNKSSFGVQLNRQGSKPSGTHNFMGTPPMKSPIRQSIRYSGPISKKYHDEGITIDLLYRLNQKNVSAWNMKKLIRIVRHGFLTTLDEHIENTNTTQEDENATQIRSEVEAKAAAKKIFRNVAKPGSKFIYLNDLARFMQEDEAIKTMNLFEGASEAGKISKPALKNWVVNAFRERRALSLTLGDTKTAVNKLHKIVDVIVSIIIILIFVVELGIISSKSVVFLSSQLVLVAFVFGNTCRNVFESIIFLFVIHPFDVGDRCEIDDVQMIVEEMNILNTIFLRWDNQKIMYPNYVLLTKPIHNYYRSPDMGDAIEFCLHIATPPERITLIKQRITSYILNKKEHWYPDPMIVLKDAENLFMLRVAIWVTHRMNFQDIGERWVRRAQLVEECIKIFRELDIEYRPFPTNVDPNSVSPMFFGLTSVGADPFVAEGTKEVVNH